MKFELNTQGLNLTSIARPKATAAVVKDPEHGKADKDGVFAKMLTEADSVAKQADVAASGLMSGQVEIHEAMIQMEKADLMLKLGTTVRNKLLDAYQQLLSSAGA